MKNLENSVGNAAFKIFCSKLDFYFRYVTSYQYGCNVKRLTDAGLSHVTQLDEVNHVGYIFSKILVDIRRFYKMYTNIVRFIFFFRITASSIKRLSSWNYFALPTSRLTAVYISS